MSQSFITFANNSICINEQILSYLSTLNSNVSIITIIGEARLGKSTFLNTIISYLKELNSYIFKTDDVIEHCTQGIDIYVYQNTHVFFDCQGINHQDSSNDIKLLLLAYLLSDTIIFNTNVINNSTLKLLEPLLSFSNFIEIDKRHKPQLFFRVKDYYLETTIGDVLISALENHDDQYDSIRNNIKTLFKSVNALHTLPLNMTAIKLLRLYKYGEIIVDHANNFSSIIRLILTECAKNFMDEKRVNVIRYYINAINNNEKLDYTILDTYTLIIKNELNEFINNIDKEFYQNIGISDSHADYENKIMPKLKKYQILINDYNEKYVNIDQELKNEYLEKIKTDIYTKIDSAFINLKKNARNSIMKILDVIFSRYISNTNNLLNFENKYECLFNKQYHNYVVNYVDKFKSILKQSYVDQTSKIYQENVRIGFEELQAILAKIDSIIFDQIKLTSAIIDNIESDNINWINNVVTVEEFLLKGVQMTVSYNLQPFQSRYNDCFNKYWNKYIKNIKKIKITHKYLSYKMCVDINAIDKINYAENPISQGELYTFSHMYVKNLYKSRLNDKIKELYNNNYLMFIKSYLREKLFDPSNLAIYKCHPNVKFYYIINPPMITDKYCAFAKIIIGQQNVFLEDDFKVFFENNISDADNMYLFLDNVTENRFAHSLDIKWNNDNLENMIRRQIVLDKTINNRFTMD